METWVWIIAFVVVAVLVARYLIGLYHELLKLQSEPNLRWTEYQSVLDQLHRELPSLREVWKAHMGFDYKMMQEVGGGRRAVRTLIESYPDLRANESFAKRTLRA